MSGSTTHWVDTRSTVPCLLQQTTLAEGCSEKMAYDFASGQPGETDAGSELAMERATPPPTTP